jgi:hypothetical protein
MVSMRKDTGKDPPENRFGTKNFPFHVQVLTEDGEREYLKKDEPECTA